MLILHSSLSLWSVTKKKPLCTVPNAHCKPENSSDECTPDESWITSIASLQSTDLLASGNTLVHTVIIVLTGFKSLRKQRQQQMQLTLFNNFASRFLWFMHQTLGVWGWFPKSKAALLNTYGETCTNNKNRVYTACKRWMSCPSFLSG